MTFSILITGDLTDPESTADDVTEVFDNTVQALRTIGAHPNGTVSGTLGSKPFTRSVNDVADPPVQDINDDGTPNLSDV